MQLSKRTALRQTIRELVEPTVHRFGCELVAIEISGSTRRPVLRLFVDRPGGVSLDVIAGISSAASPELDVADPLPVAYDLEVSSPGIERPLQLATDFERFSGYKAKIKLAGDGGRKNFTGVLRGFQDDHVLVDVDGQQLRLPFGEIDRARLDLTLDEFMALGPPTARTEDGEAPDTGA